MFPACDRRATVRRYTTVGAPSRPLGNSTCFACRFNLFSLAKQVELPSEISCFARENNLFPQGAVTDKRVVRPYARWVNKATYRQFGEPLVSGDAFSRLHHLPLNRIAKRSRNYISGIILSYLRYYLKDSYNISIIDEEKPLGFQLFTLLCPIHFREVLIHFRELSIHFWEVSMSTLGSVDTLLGSFITFLGSCAPASLRA